MEQGRVEAQQSKVQIEQGADAHCGNDGTGSHLTASRQPMKSMTTSTAARQRPTVPVRLTSQYDHERIARTGA